MISTAVKSDDNLKKFSAAVKFDLVTGDSLFFFNSYWAAVASASAGLAQLYKYVELGEKLCIYWKCQVNNLLFFGPTFEANEAYTTLVLRNSNELAVAFECKEAPTKLDDIVLSCRECKWVYDYYHHRQLKHRDLKKIQMSVTCVERSVDWAGSRKSKFIASHFILNAWRNRDSEILAKGPTTRRSRTIFSVPNEKEQ